MENLRTKPGLLRGYNLTSQYPLPTILCALGLLYLSPFVSEYLVYPAFLLCLYRVFVYDARVFATDYCILTTVMLLFRTPQGMSLLVYLCLAADVWFVLRDDFRFCLPHVFLCLILTFMLLRMQWNIGDFLLCFGQLFLMCVLLPQQDAASAERTSKLFILSLLVSSVYALVFRDTWQLKALLGSESEAIWGSSIMRFQGLFQDPNYYMTLLATAMALLAKLLDCRKITLLPFILLELCLGTMGVLTYSKTFFLVLIFLVSFGILWLFRNGKVAWGCIATLVTAAGAKLLFTLSSAFNVMLLRLTGAGNMAELTTGRTEVFAEYFRELTKNISSFLFGSGLASEGLRMDPHNIFLEIAYYIGIVGLLLIAAYYIALVVDLRQRTGMQKQNFFSKYLVLLLVLLIHCTLHGMFSGTTYAVFFLACLSLLLGKREET